MNKSEYNKRYREKHKEELKLKRQIYYQNHRDEIKRKVSEYYQENKDSRLKYAKEYAYKNKDRIASYKKDYACKNKNKIEEYKKKYTIENKDYINKYHKEYQRKRLSNDSLHKFKMQIRHLIWLSFNKKGLIKSNKTEDIIGCSVNDLIEYLLNSFRNRYNYNYDFKEKVHIDHIIPLNKAKDENDIIKLCHWTNLQLLKASDNLHKGTMNNDDYFERNFS